MWFSKSSLIGLFAVIFSAFLNNSFAANIVPKEAKCLIVFDKGLGSNRQTEPSASYDGVDNKVFQSVKSQYELEIKKKFPHFFCRNNNCFINLESSPFQYTVSKVEQINIRDYLQVCTVKDVACLGDACSFGYMKKDFVEIEWDSQRLSVSIGTLVKGSKVTVLEDFTGEVQMSQQPGFVTDLQNYVTKDGKILGIFESRSE